MREPIRNTITGLASAFLLVSQTLAEEARPEARLSVSEWAAEYRYVGAESQSPHPGRWSNDRAPYLVEPMDACQIENGISRVVLTGGAQFGKSEVPLNAMAQMIDSGPRGAMVLLPSLSEVQAYSRLKWEANVKASPRWGRNVMARKARSHDGSTTSVKRFRGGSVEFATAAASKGLQMRTIGLLVAEEVSQYDAIVGEGGDPISAAEQRGLTFGDDFKTILCSTPGFDGRCRITAEYEASDQRRWYTPCPHCGDAHVLDFDTLDEYEGRPVFSCPSCGGIIEEAHKRDMNANGFWVATFTHPEDQNNPERDAVNAKRRALNPAPPAIISPDEVEHWQVRDCEGRPRGYHLWQAQSNFSAWSRILKAWRSVEAGAGDPIEFAQKILGIPYKEIVDRPDWEVLHASRGKIYEGGETVPPWAGIITGAIDCQVNRLEWAVYAYGRGGIGARIASGVIAKDPNDPATWKEVDALINTEFSGPNCAARRADYWGIDSGGHHTQLVYAFCKNRVAQGVLPLKGASKDNGTAPPLAIGNRVKIMVKSRQRGTVILYMVGTHGLKSRVYFGLAQGLQSIEDGEKLSRALFFGSDLTEEDARQLTAEYLDRKDPREIGKWVCPEGVRNEQLDLAVYALALAINFGLDRLDDRQWQDRMAAIAPDIALAELTPLEKIAAQEIDAPPAEALSGEFGLSDEMREHLARLGRSENVNDR